MFYFSRHNVGVLVSVRRHYLNINFTFQVLSVGYTAHIQGVPGGKVNILGGHSIGHSKQKTLYEHVSYSERFPR